MDYDEYDDWEDADFAPRIMPNPLFDRVVENYWDGIVRILLYDGPYQTACINKDLEGAKQLISQGAFVDNKHLWNQQTRFCSCGLVSCITENTSYYTPMKLLFNKKNEKQEPDINVVLIKDLVNFGLLDVEDFPADEIYNAFANNCNWSSEHELCEFLISVVPPARLASIRRIFVDGKGFFSETFDPSIPSETMIHSIFMGYASKEKDL